MSSVRREQPTLPDGIAAQHGQLLGTLRALRTSWASGAGWDAVTAELDQLVRHFREHFELEELLMQRGAYPRLEEHQQQHAGFLRRLEALRGECERRETELMGVLIELLEAWFRSHEQHADRPAIEYLARVD
jgi:hemerythrin